MMSLLRQYTRNHVYDLARTWRLGAWVTSRCVNVDIRVPLRTSVQRAGDIGGHNRGLSVARTLGAMATGGARRCYSNGSEEEAVQVSLREPGHEKQFKEQQLRNRDAGSMTEMVRDFLDPAAFYKSLQGVGIDFFCGVPDSLLKDFCAYVTTNTPETNHVITPNEGNAVALATGYHLATGKHAVVYLQNSGLGNAVNPLLSLADPGVYSIPMLLLVGWRGEPGKRDEPQHMPQGRLTPNMMEVLGIPFETLPDYKEGAMEALQRAKKHMDHYHSPYALLVRRQTFLPYAFNIKLPKRVPLVREAALHIVMSHMKEDDVIVSTTGMLSRELFEYRKAKGEGHGNDFLTVGSMGHASSIALGIAKHKPDREIFCLDGDGAAIMHMGAFSLIAQQGLANFKHVIFNNGVHESVGGQPTPAINAESMKFTAIAKGCGYTEAWSCATDEAIGSALGYLRDCRGPALLEVKVMPGHRHDLGRPSTSPLQNKAAIMKTLGTYCK